MASGKLIASLGHQDAVCDAVFNPDGTQILTASWDKTAKLWDAASYKLIATFAHQGVVVAAVFSPDAARILTVSWDKTAKLWDAVSGKLIASFGHRESVENATFSPNGARILTASYDKTVRLWEVASGEPLASFTHQDGLYHAAFSRDGARILTGSADKTAKPWNAASGKLIASFYHQDGVTDTASADNTAKLWDADSGKLITSFDHQDTVQWAGFSPDGARILTVSWDKTARLWDVATPTILARLVKDSGGDATRPGSSASKADSPVLQVESLSILASGVKFSDDGLLEAVDEERRSQLAGQLKDLAQDPRPNGRFIRWFFRAGGEQTIFPASDVKDSEWVDNALMTNPNATEQWLRNALIFLPDHPLLHIALAGFESDLKRADFLRLFGLARLLKNSVICARAAEMLLAQHAPQLARAAAENALLADPKDPAAQRLRLKVLEAISR